MSLLSVLAFHAQEQGVDAGYHCIGVLTAEHVGCSVLHFYEETVGGTSMESLVSANVPLPEYAPIAHKSAGAKYAYGSHSGLERMNTFHLRYWYAVRPYRAAHDDIPAIGLYPAG